MATQQALPRHPAAERAVLTTLMCEGSMFRDVSDLLQPDDFYDPNHVEAYRAIAEVANGGGIPDYVTVGTWLKDHGSKLGFAWLAEIQSFLPDAGNLLQYVKIVSNDSKKRSIVHIAERAKMAAMRGDTLASEVGEEMITSTLLLNPNGDGEHVGEAGVTAEAVMKAGDARRASGSTGGIVTGITTLDLCIRPMHAGEIMIIGAGTGVGKTSLALQIAGYCALEQGKSVMFSCLESPKELLAARITGQRSFVPPAEIEDGSMDVHSRDSVLHVIEQLKGTKFWLDSHYDLSLPKLENRLLARRQRAGGLDVAFVDYLQLMLTSGKGDNRANEVAAISRGLKGIASRLGIPIFVIAQFSRSYEERRILAYQAGKPVPLPTNRDLAESGAIERDADKVILLHRETNPDRSREEHNLTKLIVSKQRNGQSGQVISYRWDGQLQRLEEAV